MKKPPLLPTTSGEWRVEVSRLRSEHSRLESAILAEGNRRAELAVQAQTDSAAENQFQASFETEQNLQRELSRTVALMAAAENRVKIHVAQETEAAARAREITRKQVGEKLRSHAQRVDERLKEVYAELKAMKAVYSELAGAGHLTERQISHAFRYAGLGEFITLPVSGNAYRQPLAGSIKDVDLGQKERSAA